MITSEKTVRPFKVQKFAMLEAMRCYSKWKRVKFWGAICFWIDLVDHLINGFVVSRPDCFWMMKIIDVAPEGSKPEPAWFVRMCYGDLNELLSTMPVILPKIAFSRRADNRVRIYKTETLIMKARGLGDD
jgi:hypothetical protein